MISFLLYLSICVGAIGTKPSTSLDRSGRAPEICTQPMSWSGTSKITEDGADMVNATASLEVLRVGSKDNDVFDSLRWIEVFVAEPGICEISGR